MKTSEKIQNEQSGERKLRVLLIAEACNPEWTSVPLVGWAHSQALAEVADVHLVTQIRNRDALVRAGRVERRDFTAINSEAFAKPLHKLSRLLRGGTNKGWTTSTAIETLSYYYFEHLFWKMFKKDIHAKRYDIVHRLTPLSPTTPSLLAGKCAGAGVPFVLGPLNGGVPWPRDFDAARRKEKEWLSYVRGAYRCLPGYRSTLKHAAAILVGSGDTRKQIPQAYQHKTFYVPENAIDPARFHRERQHSATRPIRAVFVGRLVPYKGADMLLEAAAPLIREGLLTVNIVGDGPQMPELVHIVEKEKIASGVQLPGWVAHTEMQNVLAEADVFAFPSVREFGGGVVIEAMAVGLVPIVVNYAGPAELVTDQTGYRVKLGTRAEVIAGFRRVLRHLAEHPEAVDAMAPESLRRARECFTWGAKALQVLEIWKWAADPSHKRPHFEMPTPELAPEPTDRHTASRFTQPALHVLAHKGAESTLVP